MADEPQSSPEAVLYPDDLPKDQGPSRSTVTAASPSTGEARRIEPTPPQDRAERLYPEDKHAGEASEPLFGPPDSAYTLKMPEGLSMTAEILREFEPAMRELNLSNAGASRLLPLAASFRDRLHKGNVDEHNRRATEWARQAKSDPDLGGKNWNETASLMKTALAAGGDDREFIELIEESRFGNHPAFIRFLRNVGRKLPKAR